MPSSSRPRHGLRLIGVALTATVVALMSFTTHAAELTTNWRLEDLYADAQAWRTAKDELPAMAAALDRYRGALGESATNLRETLDAYHDATRLAARLYTYAHLMSDLDVRKPGPLGMKQELQQLFTELAARSSWIDPEILALSPATLERYLAEDAGLAPYRRYLERLEQRRPHVLDAAGEQILGLSGLLRGDAATIGSLLRDAEIPWPTITLADGTSLRVDANGYNRGRALMNRADRIATFTAFYGTLSSFQQSLATTLAASAKSHLFNARVRSYANTLEASLAGSEVEPAVYEALVREVNAALPTLHRYLRLRGRMLGLEDLRYHDLYPSLVGEVETAYPWDRTVDEVLASFTPMGEEYVSTLRHACEQGWIDVFPAEGRSSGAYVSGSAYDVHPYMLLNHQDDYDSASTFAHEAGHMMHSVYSNREQPYPTADYETFVAEVASTTQQWLFFKHALSRASSDDERLAILGNFLEDFRTTVFRQTMFAEFERAMHRLVEEGKPITSETLNALYLDVLRRYHGHDQGVCTIDDAYAVEWAFVPHFHYNYYVYSYATSFIAGTAFHQQILTGENGGVERYIDRLLKAGSSRPPVTILADAGVDMTGPAPFRAAMAAMEDVMDQIEAILDRRASAR